ncbi:hypothetical protein DACRYDRAFT_119687 [Dacryopinax primogenitus]|uniref:GATA-type domain-containing protein n=1 Tax=Dacryopinax primogenitus (strain DJM 731) TaxID=1858805 RepID=M5FQA9_DACPD|nr:uncharacterized protein DACRYDRAFT_119687 [Dacryopinax primogenitus]EJT96854.1 hypothetical protein DACRYDRAFT_119687 [Dacryopinax primogenitus]
MSDFTRVKILYTLNSSSQLLLARTRIPSHIIPQQQLSSPFLIVPLSHILSTILHRSPELTADPGRDWSVYALDPRESRRSGGGSIGGGGVMEGRGLLSWVIAGEEEVVGRVGDGGEVEVGLRLQETKAITQQAHHAALAVLTRSPAPGTPNPNSVQPGHTASPFYAHALRPPTSSPLGMTNAYPSPLTSSVPTPELPSVPNVPSTQKPQTKEASRKRPPRQALAPLRTQSLRVQDGPVKQSGSSPVHPPTPLPTIPAAASKLPELHLPLKQDQRGPMIKCEPSPEPSPLVSPKLVPVQERVDAVLGLGLALPRASQPPPAAPSPQPREEQQVPAAPPTSSAVATAAKAASLPQGPIPPEALKNIADLLQKENSQGLLTALAGFLGVVGQSPDAKQPETAASGRTKSLPPAGKEQKQSTQTGGKKKKDETKERENKENYRPAQPALVMSKDGPCSNCGRVVTTVWRRPKGVEESDAAGQLLCNACGIYQKNNAMPRPRRMWGDPEGLPKGRKRKHAPSSASAPLLGSACAVSGHAMPGDSSLHPSSDPAGPSNGVLIHVQGDGRKRRKRTMIYDPEMARVEREGYFGRAVKAVQEEEERKKASQLVDDVARALGGLNDLAEGQDLMPGSEMEVEGMIDGREGVLRELERRTQKERERVVIELDDDGEIVTPSATETPLPATQKSANTDNTSTSIGEEQELDAEPRSPKSVRMQDPEPAPETPYIGALPEGGSLFTPASALRSSSSLALVGHSSSSIPDAPTSPSPNPSQQRACCIPTLRLPPQLRLPVEEGESPLVPPSSPPGVGQRFDFSGLPPSSPVLLMDKEDEDVDELDLTPPGDAMEGPGEEELQRQEQGQQGQEQGEEETRSSVIDRADADDLARFLQGEMSSEAIEKLFMVSEHRASPVKHTSHVQQEVDYSQLPFNFPLDYGMFGPAGGAESSAVSPAHEVPSMLGHGMGEYSSEATLAVTSVTGMELEMYGDANGGEYDFNKEFGEVMKELGISGGFHNEDAGNVHDPHSMEMSAETLEEIFRTLNGDMGVLV